MEPATDRIIHLYPGPRFYLIVDSTPEHFSAPMTQFLFTFPPVRQRPSDGSPDLWGGYALEDVPAHGQRHNPQDRQLEETPVEMKDAIFTA
jgi:hypothetical protein